MNLLYKISGITGLSIIALFGAFIYGRYVATNKCQEKQYRIRYEAVVQDNKMLQQQIKLNNDVVLSYNGKIKTQRESYEELINEIQTNEHNVKHKLDSTNYTNKLLWNLVRTTLNTKQVRITNPTSAIDKDTTTYIATSDIVKQIAIAGQQCREQYTQLTELIKWIEGVSR